jgi:hypothetical protein
MPILTDVKIISFAPFTFKNWDWAIRYAEKAESLNRDCKDITNIFWPTW